MPLLEEFLKFISWPWTKGQLVQSELWRLEWAFHNCISVAAITLIAFLPGTKNFLPYGSLAFAGFVTVVVKDITFGATFWNGWSCILGGFVASLLCYCLSLFAESVHIFKDYPVYLVIILVFVSSFLVQYLDLPPLGKKLGVSLVAVNILSFRDIEDVRPDIYGWYLAVLVGVACSFVGVIIPLPIKFAGYELQGRIRFYSEALSSILNETVIDWTRQIYRFHNFSITKTLDFSLPLQPATGFKHFISYDLTKVEINRLSENKHWRKLRLLITTLSVWKRSMYTGLAWYQRDPGNRTGARFLRMELIRYLEDNLEVLNKRDMEARFGPTRSNIEQFQKFLKIVREILSVLKLMEKRIKLISAKTHLNYIHFAFHSRPTFRHTLRNFSTCLSEAIQTTADMLSTDSTSFRNNYKLNDILLSYLSCTRGETQIKIDTLSPKVARAALKISELMKAKDLFEDTYYSARRAIYYSHEGIATLSSHNKEMRSRKLKSRKNKAKKGATYDEKDEGEFGIPGTESLDENLESVLPLQSDVFIDMNTVIFYMDTISRLLVDSWSSEQISESIKTLDNSLAAVSAGERTVLHPSLWDWVVYNYTWVYKQVVSLRRDLLPNQNYVCFGFYIHCQRRATSLLKNEENSGWREILSYRPILSCTFPLVLRKRLLNCFTVATAMGLAGIYGIYAERPQPGLAAFTVAFLAGGPVTAINVMTSINRAAGTVIACVYVIIIIFIVSGWESRLARDLFVGFAVVLFQIPSTYVRSFPIYSYSGTVAGFTTAVLLLDQNIQVSTSVDRIIDTFIGVVLYLLLEFILSAQYTEQTIIDDMGRVFYGIKDSFLYLRDAFKMVADTNSHSFLSATDSIVLSPQKLDFTGLFNLIGKQRSLIPFYYSEPKIFNPPTFPDELIQNSIKLQEQAVNSLQVMRYAIQACENQNLRSNRHRNFHILAEKIKLLDQVKVKLQNNNSESFTFDELDHSGSFGLNLVEDLPDIGALLAPLESHFEELEDYVSNMTMFLAVTAQQLQNWSGSVNQPPEVRSNERRRRRFSVQRANLLPIMTDKTTKRLDTELLKLYQSRKTREDGETKDGADSIGFYQIISSLGDLESRQSHGLFAGFQRTINSLQLKHFEERRSNTRILSNGVVKVTNAVLAATQQLLEALKGLAEVLSRMQAHRDLHITQSGVSSFSDKDR